MTAPVEQRWREAYRRLTKLHNETVDELHMNLQRLGRLQDEHEVLLDCMERDVKGALISTVDSHGPITRDKASSAAKRIVGALQALKKRSMAALEVAKAVKPE